MRKSKLKKWEEERIIPAFQQILDNLEITAEMVRSNSRQRPLPDYRKIIAYRISKDFHREASFSSIGYLINRDHSSVVVAIKEAKVLKEFSKEFNALLDKSYVTKKTDTPIKIKSSKRSKRSTLSV